MAARSQASKGCSAPLSCFTHTLSRMPLPKPDPVSTAEQSPREDNPLPHAFLSHTVPNQACVDANSSMLQHVRVTSVVSCEAVHVVA